MHDDGVGGAHAMRVEGGTSRVGRAAARAEGATGMVRQDDDAPMSPIRPERVGTAEGRGDEAGD